MLLIRLLAIFLLLPPVLADELDRDYCGPKGAIFAKCSNVRTFDTVLLTIHGWRGSCKTTFGESSSIEKFGSIFELFADNRFFDLDCFSYDSEKNNIDSHTQALEQHLNQLFTRGYQDVILVTHSTGGVIALNLIVERLDNAIVNEKFDQISIRSILAWATPINGLRWHVTKGGSALNFFGITQETLPQLDSEHKFLKILRSRLKVFPETLKEVSLGQRKTFDTHVEYYHGMGKDWVVKEITNDDRREGWLWPAPNGKLIDIDTGHVSNISDPGNPIVHTFPGKVVESEVLKSLPLKLNIGSIFPINSTLDPQLESAQRAMLNGVAFHAASVRQAYNNATIKVLLDLLKRVLLNEYARFRDVDFLLLKHLKQDIFSLKLIETDNFMRELVYQFAKDILSKYSFASEYSERRPGFGDREFNKQILLFAAEIEEELRESDTANQEQISQIRASLLEFTLNALNSPQKNTQEVALNILYNNIPDYPDKTLQSVDIVGRLSDYYIPRSNKLGAKGKQQIASTLLNVSQRGSQVGLEAASFFNSQVNFNGRQVPVWRSFQSVAFDNHIFDSASQVAITDTAPAGWKKEWTITLGAQSIMAGSKGNQPTAVSSGYSAGLNLFRSLTKEEQEHVNQEIQLIHSSEGEEPYYFLQRNNSPLKWKEMVVPEESM